MMKNKFLVIFLISISFVLLLTFNQKASAIFQVESNNDDTTFYNLPDLPEKPNNCQATLIVQKNIDNVDYFYLYYLSSSYEKACFITNKVNNYFQLLSYVPKTPTDIKTYIVENNSWVLKGSSFEYNETMSLGYTYYENNTNYIKDFLYSDKDVYQSKVTYNGLGYSLTVPDTEQEPFFPSPSIWKVNLFKARELTEILPMVNKLVTILIPIGLAIFSVLSVLYLIKSKKWRSF